MTETRDAAAAPERRAGSPRRGTDRPALPARIALYVRQVVAELRKVIWPTRNQLLTYTAVVIVFVTVMIAIVAAIDYVLSRGVVTLFG